MQQKKLLRTSNDGSDALVQYLQNQLYIAEQEAATLVAREIAQNPPNPLMAVITPQNVGGWSGSKRRGPNEEGGDRRAHVVRYRYGDAYLMKAEAMWRMGNDPTTMINDLRTVRGASSLASVGEADLLAERGREMYQEMTRRQDLIRFDQYLRAWNLKDAGADYLKIFPIPLSDALGNPNLTQNPGY